MRLQGDPENHFGDSPQQTGHPYQQPEPSGGKEGDWPRATNLTDLPGGRQQVSSSLKEKWTRDSGHAWGTARTGGRGQAQACRPELERMGAKRCRGTHEDGCTLVWCALLARPEVSAAAAGAVSTPALPVNPTPQQAPPRAFGRPRPQLREGSAPPLPSSAGALRNSTHSSRLPLFPRTWGVMVPRALVSRAPGPPFPLLAPPSPSPPHPDFELGPP